MRHRRTTPHETVKLNARQNVSEDTAGEVKNDAHSELEFVEVQA
jgi:hypothetical protein